MFYLPIISKYEIEELKKIISSFKTLTKNERFSLKNISWEKMFTEKQWTSCEAQNTYSMWASPSPSPRAVYRSTYIPFPSQGAQKLKEKTP